MMMQGRRRRQGLLVVAAASAPLASGFSISTPPPARHVSRLSSDSLFVSIEKNSDVVAANGFEQPNNNGNKQNGFEMTNGYNPAYVATYENETVFNDFLEPYPGKPLEVYAEEAVNGKADDKIIDAEVEISQATTAALNCLNKPDDAFSSSSSSGQEESRQVNDFTPYAGTAPAKPTATAPTAPAVPTAPTAPTGPTDTTIESAAAAGKEEEASSPLVVEKEVYEYTQYATAQDDFSKTEWDQNDDMLYSLNEIFLKVQALTFDNKAMQRDLKLAAEVEQELLYEQDRLEREVELLQDQMVQLQNKYRSLDQERERLENEVDLMREAKHVDYTRRLGPLGRLELAEESLRRRNIYLSDDTAESN